MRLAIGIELKMTQELIIEAGRTERGYWHDIWQYRELFQIMAWRDVVVRYKQTVIGAAWALIRPYPWRNPRDRSPRLRRARPALISR